MQYWNCAKGMGAIERHYRTQVSVSESSATPQDKITQDLFYTTHHKVTIQDSEAIMDRATWPVFSPQTQSSIFAAQEFLPMLGANSNWEKASACWKCVFFPRGTIVYNRDTKEYRLCIGTMHNILILAWKVNFQTAISERTANYGICNWIW